MPAPGNRQWWRLARRQCASLIRPTSCGAGSSTVQRSPRTSSESTRALDICCVPRVKSCVCKFLRRGRQGTQVRRHFKKNVARYVIVLMLSASLPIVVSGSSTAAPVDCGGAGGFEGFGNYSTPPRTAHEVPIGVSGAITARGPSICGNQVPTDIFSMVWVMLEDRDTGGLGQAGLVLETGTGVRNASSCLQDFYEWHHDRSSGFNAPAGGRFRFSTCIPDGSHRQYWVTSTSTNKSTSQLAFSIAPFPGPRGGSLYTTQWHQLADWTYIEPQYFAETSNAGADIVGKASSKSSIYGMGIQPADGSAQISTPCYLASADSAPRGYVSASGCGTTYQWTS